MNIRRLALVALPAALAMDLRPFQRRSDAWDAASSFASSDALVEFVQPKCHAM